MSSTAPASPAAPVGPVVLTGTPVVPGVVLGPVVRPAGAVRLPDDDLTRDLLRRTGPLAVSSANRSGRPAATTAQEAAAQLGDHAAVVLDGGPRSSSAASTIVDCTGPTPRVLRVGAIPVDKLREVVPELTD